MKIVGKRKITPGYVEQVFDEDGHCIYQGFEIPDHGSVEWEDEAGKDIEPITDCYQPFDMVQPIMFAVQYKNSIVGPFQDAEDALAWYENHGEVGEILMLRCPN